jgi:zinc and cadmium transporter
VTLLLILASSLAGGPLAALLAGTVLAVNPPLLDRAVPRLVSFSTGALLGAALLRMVPHAAQALPGSEIASAVLAGLVLFHMLERLLVWRHCHEYDCDVHASTGPLLLVGDAFHGLVDGLVIAGAFLSSVPLGLAAALSARSENCSSRNRESLLFAPDGLRSREKATLFAMFPRAAELQMIVIACQIPTAAILARVLLNAENRKENRTCEPLSRFGMAASLRCST